ncbi:MAG: DUF5908 family protein [Dehalococcoidia bacterium]
MTIEVKQLQIKSNVLPEENRASPGTRSSVDPESIKEDVLSECRKLILEMLQAERER